MAMQQDEQGWSYSDDWVCTDCVRDRYLVAQIVDASEDNAVCTFCENTHAAPLDALMGPFMDGVRRLYVRAVEEVNVESGSYVIDTVDSWDVVEDFGDVLVGEGLLEAVRDLFSDEAWVPSDWARNHPGGELSGGWRRFSNAVKFETRYVFALRKDDLDLTEWDDVPVALMLEAVANLVKRLGFVKELPTGTRSWRAQYDPAGPVDITAARLGTVPAWLARQPNRMSPAGIPMFYGAGDIDTAIGEVTPDGATTGAFTWGAFDTSQPCWIVDLTSLPRVPSIFDPSTDMRTYQEAQFLRSFVHDLAKRATPAWEAVDYVPTQVLTEFFLHVFDDGQHPVAGLIYRSGVTQSRCIVLNVRNEQCVEQDEGWEVDARANLRLGLAPATTGSRTV